VLGGEVNNIFHMIIGDREFSIPCTIWSTPSGVRVSVRLPSASCREWKQVMIEYIKNGKNKGYSDISQWTEIHAMRIHHTITDRTMGRTLVPFSLIELITRRTYSPGPVL
jgi:hypothetical protein